MILKYNSGIESLVVGREILSILTLLDCQQPAKRAPFLLSYLISALSQRHIDMITIIIIIIIMDN